jgi:bifunctional non-homologous end joining protein LigD
VSSPRAGTRRAAETGPILRVGQREIRVSHADRVLFPEPGITKGEIVEYYRRASPVMLPHVRGRPVMMQRLTDGLGGQVFYQKQISSHFPDWIHRVTVEKTGGTVTHVVCDDAATLVYIANQGCITPHVWPSRADDPDRPDRLIFDLDPGPGGTDDARFAAHTSQRFLTELGLVPFLMATGSRGFHVVVPIRRSDSFDSVREVAAGLADALASREPDRLTTEFRKTERRGRLYVDWVRNTYAQTTVPPYAVRPRAQAPVAVPLDWDELDTAEPDGWTVRTVLDRLDRGSDPWRDIGRHARSLAKARRSLDQSPAAVRSRRR